MARPRTYIIKLSDDERAVLQKVIKNKKTCKSVLKRYQILLELDEEHGTRLTHAQIANSYAVCKATVVNVVQSYVKNRITDIIQIACGLLPDGYSHWTLRLLEKKLRMELEISVGKETIRQTKKELRPHLSAYWCIPPKKRRICSLYGGCSGFL